MGGVEVWLRTFLPLALDGGVWSPSAPIRLTTGGWLSGPQARVDAFEKNSLAPAGMVETRYLGRSVCSLVIIPTELPRHLRQWEDLGSEFSRLGRDAL
jgi:hypothetical protein